MSHFVCRTPGCPGFISKDPPDTISFCQRCGWPLGQAEYLPQGGRISYPKGALGRLLLRVRNTGSGALRWDTGDLPQGLRRIDRADDIAPGGEGVLELEVDGTVIEGSEIVVPIRTWDRCGKDSLDFRLEPAEQAFREGVITYTTRTTKVGPLICSKDAVLFFPTDRKQAFVLKNEGESELTVEFSCSSCHVTVALCPDVRGRQASGRFRIDAGLQRTVEIRLDEEAERGEVTLSSPGVWPESRQIQAVRVAPDSSELPEYQYVVAVDFGTTKSAAMVFDQWHIGTEPEPVLWPKPDGSLEVRPKTPLTVSKIEHVFDM